MIEKGSKDKVPSIQNNSLSRPTLIVFLLISRYYLHNYFIFHCLVHEDHLSHFSVKWIFLFYITSMVTAPRIFLKQWGQYNPLICKRYGNCFAGKGLG